MSSAPPLHESLPLRYKTPLSWVQSATQDLPRLLSDHAYLERKAASNALDLLNRWPLPGPSADWTVTLTGIARDEAIHLNQVIRLMETRGFKLQRLHKSQYANDLRQLVRVGKGPDETIDRLMISALIEARSCERFDLLARGIDDNELKNFYRSLWTSEFGHYHVFLKLAYEVKPPEEVRFRWLELLKYESIVIQKQPQGSLLHSRAPST